MAFRTKFAPIGLTPGDSATLSGKFSLDNTYAGSSAYLGWSWAHIGLYNSNGNAGTLEGTAFTGGSQNGYTGYTMIITTSTSGTGSPWGSGPLGAIGARLKGNTTAWTGQTGAYGLGGAFQSPENSGVGKGSFDFTIKVTRLSSYLSRVDYHLQNEEGTSAYLLEGTVYDTGVNADGTTSTLSFDTVGINSS
ncbi:MAG TPA: hypothetical protein PKI32_02280, partial [Opitutales bacterium]|nr:hypothetical protein [Opitutales bacterium]